jgi:hypothetical protein
MTTHAQLKYAIANIAAQEKRVEQARKNYERACFWSSRYNASRRAAAAYLDSCERDLARLLETPI